MLHNHITLISLEEIAEPLWLEGYHTKTLIPKRSTDSDCGDIIVDTFLVKLFRIYTLVRLWLCLWSFSVLGIPWHDCKLENKIYHASSWLCTPTSTNAISGMTAVFSPSILPHDLNLCTYQAVTPVMTIQSKSTVIITHLNLFYSELDILHSPSKPFFQSSLTSINVIYFQKSCSR